jgi:hypothetical protein
MIALLREPGVGVPEPAVEEAVEPIEAAAEPIEAAAEPIEAAAEPIEAAAGTVEEAVEPDSQGGSGTVADEEPLDREAAMVAIQAAAEAAATVDAPADAPADGTADGEPDPTAPDSWASAQEPEVDPRLAMLGLTPDFAAAEMAAVEMAAAEVQDVPEIGGDALAARLSGLVPGDAPAADAATVTTQVIVTGLVSVASIASFKRHMGRLAGVGHVGVSSGPDTEFVFTVAHEPATALRDLIPTLPGFAARVVGSEDGVIHVSAQDPQD